MMDFPQVIVEARDGAEIRFKLPVDHGSLERHRGHSIEIDVGGLCFQVVINNPIRLPLTCSSFQEARELAMSVSLQVMSAVLQPADPALSSAVTEASLVPRLEDLKENTTELPFVKRGGVVSCPSPIFSLMPLR